MIHVRGISRPMWKQQSLWQLYMTLLSFCVIMTVAQKPEVSASTPEVVSVQLRSDLKADMKIIEGESKMLEVNLTYQGTGQYLGIGWSSNKYGTMKGSECVIGTSGLSPAKYSMSSNSADASGVNRMSNAKQTLQNATWVESDDDQTTVLSFRKLLEEDGEVPINTESMTFIWAVGEDDGFTTHRHKGISVIDLVKGKVEALDPPHKNDYFLHGVFAFLAWGVFAPIAIAASVLKDYFSSTFCFNSSSPLWLQLHLFCNILSVVATVVTFAIVVNVYQKMGIAHFGHAAHEKIGLFLFIAVTFQALAGIFRPSLPHQKKTAKATKGNNNNDAESGLSKQHSTSNMTNTKHTTDEEDTSIDEKKFHDNDNNNTPLEKSLTRIYWEYSHKLFGYAFLAIAIFEVQDGMGHYGSKFEVDVKTYKTAFFAWIGSLIGLVAILKLYHIQFIKK